MKTFIEIAYLLFAAGLFWTTICRLNKLDRSALLRVRAAFYVLGLGAALAIFALFFWGHSPSPIEVVLAGTYFFVQAITSVSWKQSYPKSFSSVPAEFDQTPRHHPPSTTKGTA